MGLFKRLHRITIGRIEAFLAGIPEQRRLRVHYEQLAENPRQAMERLCRWLDIKPEEGMLQPRNNAPEALAWDLGDEQVLRHEGVDARLAERWRERFDEHMLDSRTRAIMARLAGPEADS